MKNLSPTWIFLVSVKVLFSKGTSQSKQGGKKDGQGRVERAQEMLETVETVLGVWDGKQVHSSFHTDVNEKEYKDLLTSTFTQADHERDMKNWGVKDGYPQCVFYTHSYRYLVDRVECHMDPTINKD